MLVNGCVYDTPARTTQHVFTYPCPGCRSTNVLHARDCRFADRPREEVERAQVEIVSTLSSGPLHRDELRESIEDPWDELYEASIRMLARDARIEIEDERAGQRLYLVPPDEIADRIEPVDEPLLTIYKHGSVPGAYDNSVFAMVAYYSSKGLSWEDTRRQVVNWLEESGTWARGGFEERSPEALVEGKKHVHNEGYGWLEKATAARRVIEDSHLVNP